MPEKQSEPLPEQSEKLRKLAAKVTDRYGEATRNQRSIIDEMELARLFYRGDQWPQKSKSGQWSASPQPRWRVRLVINKLPPLVELVISTFLRYKPIIIATPSTDEDADRRSAKVSEQLLRHFWTKLEFDEFLVELLQWVIICGSGFLRVRWDATKGKKIARYKTVTMPHPDTGEPVEVETEEVEEMVPEGEPVVDVISPFSISVEPGATKIEDAGWVIVTEILHKNDLEMRFGEEVQTSDLSNEQMHIPLLLEQNVEKSNSDRVALHQYYEKPSKKNPNGQLIHVANGRVMGEPEELLNGEFGIFHFKGICLPGEFWPTSLVTQVVSLQMELNRGRSQLVENRNLCSRPQIVSAIGAIQKGTWNNKPGNILKWNPVMGRGHEPHYLAPPTIPQWVMSTIAMASEDMMDLASRHEASQGQQASNVTSGKQAAMYQNADDSRLAPAVRIFESGLKKVGKNLLRLCQAKMKGEQIITIIGKNRVSEVFRFEANDVADTANITYEIASQIPWARENMKQHVREMNREGKIDDETMFNLLEMPTIQKLYENEQEHRLNARQENQMLAQVYFQPLASDNHATHLQEHERQVNLPENRMAHIQEMVSQQQTQQMEAQMNPEAEQQQPPQWPPSIQNIMQHMEAHRGMMPKAQPPPPAEKVNLSLDRLLMNPAVQANPELMQQILQQILENIKDVSQQPVTPAQGQQPTSAGARAPMDNFRGKPTKTQMEGSGAEAGIGMEGMDAGPV